MKFVKVDLARPSSEVIKRHQTIPTSSWLRAPLSYISSAGLRAVLVTAKMLWSREAKFVLCSLPAQIRGVFETSGFDKVIALHPSRAEALASLDE